MTSAWPLVRTSSAPCCRHAHPHSRRTRAPPPPPKDREDLPPAPPPPPGESPAPASFDQCKRVVHDGSGLLLPADLAQRGGSRHPEPEADEGVIGRPLDGGYRLFSA